MAPGMKIVFGLLTFVTVGMIIGALFQLAFIRGLEDSYGSDFPTAKLRVSQSDGYLKLPRGMSHWHGDKEAEILRLGYVSENGELIQVLRYEKDQFYKPHHDYFSDTFNLKRGGQRIATMLMYLSNDVEGGETYFPMAGTGDCSCGGKIVKGLSVKPVKGDAVLFWSMGLDGQSDPNSIHGGCEVLSGEKWSATKWMRQKPTF
ncbi:P4H isoform 2 [Theobroma cacao]|uniref:P4H isoform 2 n=1 Tax=Theobroma cacao TaxID=3641 RepID=A0A061EJ70_THECC|nr:P4H isoform 2 [Theobroma cacao]